jgi:hypothetical protein
MSPTLLILTPLLVLGVVLLLGFAGCIFHPGTPPIPPPPPHKLIFRATVPTAFAVLAVGPSDLPGVKFIWMRPGGTTESLVAITPTLGMDGTVPVHVYEIDIATPGDGVWTGRCDMTVREGSATAVGSSMDHFFTPDFAATPQTAVSFRGEGSPQAGLFAVVYAGLGPA